MKHSMLITRWSSWTPGCWLRGIVVSLILCGTQVSAAYAIGPVAMNFSGQITLQDGKLTARIIRVPLRQVIMEVSRLSGAQVQWRDQDGGEQNVSVEFTNLPFPEALKRILRKKNFVLFHTSTGQGTKFTQIWISSRGEGGGQPVIKRQPVPEEETTPIAQEPAEDVVQPLDVVIQTAVSNEDLSSRLRAIEYLGRHAREDAKVTEILSQLAHTDSNPQVQDVASAVLAGIE